MTKKLLLAIIGLFIIITTQAQVRTKQTINTSREFYKGDIPGYPATPASHIE